MKKWGQDVIFDRYFSAEINILRRIFSARFDINRQNFGIYLRRNSNIVFLEMLNKI